MSIVNRGQSAILFLGDILFFYISLWLMLFFRYLEIPTRESFELHILPFSVLFLVWLVIFYIAGLYENRTALIKNALLGIIFRTQILNAVLAVLFFYFVPLFAIAPKTNLFLYLIISLAVFAFWRIWLFSIIKPKTKHNALLIARGEEMIQLKDEINSGRYNFYISHSINLEKAESINIKEDIIDPIYSDNISTVIIDTKDDTVIPLLPNLYNLMFSNVNFVDAHEIYEYLFNRIPLSLVKHGWFLENFRSKPHLMYDALKRLMDIFISFILAIISLVVYPFIIILLKLDKGRGVFSIQERVGKGNKKIKLYKFRTMLFANDGGNWQDKGIENRVTTIGNYLRKTRVDELPQLWNVLKGDLSLIGPRPEFAKAVEKYNEEIPYYNVRHLIKPGLSGWAQIYGEHPHHEENVELTRNKLSHDLYYIKNRSLFLDFKIALKTLKTIILSKGK